VEGVHGIPSYLKLPTLAKRKMLTHFNCLVLPEHANDGSKQARKGETRISAPDYHDILQDFDCNFYLEVFLGVLA
jgi:hypothetical protein